MMFEVFVVVKIYIVVFWVMTLCSLACARFQYHNVEDHNMNYTGHDSFNNNIWMMMNAWLEDILQTKFEKISWPYIRKSNVRDIYTCYLVMYWYVTGYEWLNYKQRWPMKMMKEGASAKGNAHQRLLRNEVTAGKLRLCMSYITWIKVK
jgi:hypothetical protein